MAKRAPAWTRVFDSIRVDRQPRYIYHPPATDAELDQAEKELGTPLPLSYREFMKRFGPGELFGHVQIYPIVALRKNEEDQTLVGRTKTLHTFFSEGTFHFDNREWLSTVVFFACSGGMAEYVWDPTSLPRSRTNECKLYELGRHEEENPIPRGRNLGDFIRWVDQDVRSWRDPEHFEEDGDELYFDPRYVRAKKKPRQTDVQRWRAWNEDTIGRLATTFREDGDTAVLPILADALQDAGCDHEDLLNSCRSPFPEVDGVWVADVLLGKEPKRRRR